MSESKPNYHQQLRDLLAKEKHGALSDEEKEEVEILRKIIHKDGSDSTSTFVVAIIFMLMGVGFIKFISDYSPSEAPESEPRPARVFTDSDAAATARLYCRWYIEEQLREPDSARWISESSEIKEGGLVLVSGVVAARNGFGGISSQKYGCLYSYSLERKTVTRIDGGLFTD